MPSKKDQELIAAATEAISQRYRNDWQEVGAALREQYAYPLWPAELVRTRGERGRANRPDRRAGSPGNRLRQIISSSVHGDQRSRSTNEHFLSVNFDYRSVIHGEAARSG